jgi:hypothetical protein
MHSTAITPKKDLYSGKVPQRGIGHIRQKSAFMADRRTKRNRTRTAQNRAALNGDS